MRQPHLVLASVGGAESEGVRQTCTSLSIILRLFDQVQELIHSTLPDAAHPSLVLNSGVQCIVLIPSPVILLTWAVLAASLKLYNSEISCILLGACP